MKIDKEIKHQSRRGLLELDLFLSDFIDNESSLMAEDNKRILLDFLMLDDMAMLDIMQKKVDPITEHKNIVSKIECFNANLLQKSRQ
jgi:succinate dehydrogenase flavin-adding protein (antitoxin of CptAB toxin-antitoxin module)|tara:strand:- start:584 stop:844 length:261 start_codon:yes stop_codon:yes gene_type:complete